MPSGRSPFDVNQCNPLLLAQFNPKSATTTCSGLDPHASPHAFDAFGDNRQANAGAGILFPVETNEGTKDLLLMLRGNANALIFHPEPDPRLLVVATRLFSRGLPKCFSFQPHDR